MLKVDRSRLVDEKIENKSPLFRDENKLDDLRNDLDACRSWSEDGTSTEPEKVCASAHGAASLLSHVWAQIRPSSKFLE